MRTRGDRVSLSSTLEEKRKTETERKAALGRGEESGFVECERERKSNARERTTMLTQGE